MRTILFVESGESGGGSFESLYQHLRAIDRERLRPVVVFLNHGRYVDLVRALGVQVHVLTDPVYSKHASRVARRSTYWLRRAAIRIAQRVPSIYLIALGWIHRSVVSELARLVREHDVDIVHLNVHVYRDIFGLFAADKAKVRCVCHLRSADPRTRGEFNAHMARYANRVAAAYVANSAMTRAYWLEHGLDPNKMWLVRNGIHSSQIDALDVRKEWGLDEAAPVLGCVAPLRNRLKVDESLIRGFASLLRISPQAILLIVGEGPMRPMLAREADALGLRDSVKFVGFQDRAKQIIAGVDVSLVISEFDSFSRVVLETMLVGTPLVATDVGGIREIVRHMENGVLIPYGDPDAFAKSVSMLLEDPEIRARVAEGGRRTATEEFSIGRYAMQIDRIYQSLDSSETSQEVGVGVKR